jgi:hypothetical protein
VLVFAVFWGCSGRCNGPSSPSASDGRKVYENTNSDIQNGKVKILNFHKITGWTQKNPIWGTITYVLEYEVELEDLIDEKGGLFSSEHEKGRVSKPRGTMEFLQTDTGWRGEDGNIY